MLPHGLFRVDAMTEVSLILLQAEEKQGNDTSGSGVSSSSHADSAIPPVASADERRPAEDSQPNLQRPQAGLQAPHVQAQPQVQSQNHVLLSSTTASVLDLQNIAWATMSAHLGQHD